MSKQSFKLIGIFSALVALGMGCGVKGPPLPPIETRPDVTKGEVHPSLEPEDGSPLPEPSPEPSPSPTPKAKKKKVPAKKKAASE